MFVDIFVNRPNSLDENQVRTIQRIEGLNEIVFEYG